MHRSLVFQAPLVGPPLPLSHSRILLLQSMRITLTAKQGIRQASGVSHSDWRSAGAAYLQFMQTFTSAIHATQTSLDSTAAIPPCPTSLPLPPSLDDLID